jgi:hypothetical protein
LKLTIDEQIQGTLTIKCSVFTVKPNLNSLVVVHLSEEFNNVIKVQQSLARQTLRTIIACRPMLDLSNLNVHHGRNLLSC